MKPTVFFWILLFVLTGARFASLATAGLTPAETYFWLLGERWEWASFEGPGGLPALAALLSATIGPRPELLHLLPPLALLLGSAGLWWWGRKVASTAKTMWMVAGWNCIPFLNSEILRFGPEALTLALWIWFWALVSEARRDREGPDVWWMLAAITATMGVLVSYTLILAPLGLTALLLYDRFAKKLPPGRNHLWRILPIVLPLFALTGPLVWNLQTSWIAFAGNTFQTLVSPGGSRSIATVQALFWAGGMLLPLFSLLLLIRLGKHGPRDPLLLAATLPPFFWLGWELWRGGNAFSPWILFLSALLPFATAAFSHKQSPEQDRAKHRHHALRTQLWNLGAAASLLVAALLSATIFVFQTATPPAVDWRAASERVDRVARIYQPADEEPPFLIAGNSDAAAALGFFLLERDTGPRKDFPPVFLKESQNLASQFGLWPRYDEFLAAPALPDSPLFREQEGINPFLGKNAIYFGEESPDSLPQAIRNGFLRVYPLESLSSPSGEIFYLYFCEDYQTAPL